MDINTLRSFSPVLVMLAFIGICWWAFSPSRRQRFEEAARLPFADEPPFSNESERLKDAEQPDSAKAKKQESL
jgi:cytochrome c oxidase cbb3-type subunit IV